MVITTDCPDCEGSGKTPDGDTNDPRTKFYRCETCAGSRRVMRPDDETDAENPAQAVRQ